MNENYTQKIKIGTPHGVVIRINFNERTFMPEYACFMASGKGVTTMLQNSIDVGHLVNLMHLYQINLEKIQLAFKQNYTPIVLIYSDGCEDVIVEYINCDESTNRTNRIHDDLTL